MKISRRHQRLKKRVLKHCWRLTVTWTERYEKKSDSFSYWAKHWIDYIKTQGESDGAEHNAVATV